jgi:glycosyltransferase involved in cell wall biosynthesis
MMNPNPTKVVFLCTFPPGANLEVEGLGRYFGALFGSATSTNVNYDFVIATFPWHRRWASNISKGSKIRVETHLPKGISGLVLLIWSFRRVETQGLKRKVKAKLLNKQALIYNIHVISAGVLPYSLERNSLIKSLFPILRIIARAILFISSRLFNEKKFNFDPASAEEKITRYKANEFDLARVFFDTAVKKLFNKTVQKFVKEKAILVSMNNRFEIQDSRKNILLVPDVIPIMNRDIFVLDNARWDALIADIRNACLKSQNWITFSNSTQRNAQLLGLQPESADVKVIPHASVPPSGSFQEFETIKGRGLGDQWIDYYWRSGQAKVTNQLFRFPSFNQNLVYIIYPTQYRPHKKVELLIESWARVIQYHPEYKLVLTLNKARHPHLQEKIVRLGLSNSILFAPNLSDSELLAWQARAKFIISTSSIEGAMPFMVSESIHVGVPFLIPSLAVSKEVLPETVLNLSELRIDTPEALTKSLLTAIKHRDKIKKLQDEWSNSYSRSWSDVWQEWMRTIERVAEK